MQIITIIVCNTNTLSILVPVHICNDALVSVINHFLVPEPFEENPDNDEAIGVRGG